MNNLTTFILIIFFLFLTGQETGAKSQQDNTLKETWDQCEEMRFLCNYDSLAFLSHKLYTYAHVHTDKRYEAYALFYKGLSQLFTGNSRKSFQTLNNAKDISEEIGNDSITALIMNSLGIYYAMSENNSFIAQQYFFRSLHLAEQSGYEQLKGRVYGNMLILTQSKNDTTGLDNAFKIYNYGKRYNDREQTFMGAYYLAMYYNLQGDNDKSEIYLNESLLLHKQYQYEDIAAVYTLYSKVINEKGDIHAAENYELRAIQLAKTYNQMGLLPDAYLQYATILHEQGKYAQSNQAVQAALYAEKQASSATKTASCLQLMAKNCRKLGQKDLALNFLEEATQVMDTLSRINMERLMHERSIMLDIEQKEQEAKVRKQQIDDQKKLNIILFVTTILLIVLLSIIVTNYRKRNRLYKRIVSQNAKAVNKQAELQKRIDKLTECISNEQYTKEEAFSETGNPDMPSRISVDNEIGNSNERSKALFMNDNRVQDLYEKACQLMEKERLYTDSQLNREKLAELLGTNRTYLTKIIKEKSGMNYVQFINSYRINEAIRILSDHTMTNYPLKQIWSDLGFNSPATFYKLFQQTVGITPSVYRKQFIDMEQE